MTIPSYVPAALDEESLTQTLDLMRLCFPKAKHYSLDLLSWLYLENPVGEAVGINAFDGRALVGHLVGIPQRVRLHGEPATAILFLNVATHPGYRGKGIFLELARKTAERAKGLGHSAIIGVANQNTIAGYEKKLGWQNVAGLDARISLAPPRLDIRAAVERADFAREWDQSALNWRMRNPANKLRPIAATNDTLVIQGATPYPGIRVRGTIPRKGLHSGPGLPPAPSPAPALLMGLQPEGTARHGLAIPIPEKVKPSPLRLIYRNLHAPADRLDPKSILFSFLDFDAF